MNQDSIDPSLCTGEPLLESLDDGFSPPAVADATARVPETPASAPEPVLGAKSLF